MEDEMTENSDQENRVPERPDHGTDILSGRLFFAQIPQSLLRDSTISRSARLLFALYHSYAHVKNLEREPSTSVSQKTLAKSMGCTVQSVSNWTRELRNVGWIKSKRKGLQSNVTRLFPKPWKRRRP